MNLNFKFNEISRNYVLLNKNVPIENTKKYFDNINNYVNNEVKNIINQIIDCN